MRPVRPEMKTRIKKYLRREGIPLPSKEADRPVKIVIPALAESDAVLGPLFCLAEQGGYQNRTEVLIVVNNAEDDRSWIF